MIEEGSTACGQFQEDLSRNQYHTEWEYRMGECTSMGSDAFPVRFCRSFGQGHNIWISLPLFTHEALSVILMSTRGGTIAPRGLFSGGQHPEPPVKNLACCATKCHMYSMPQCDAADFASKRGHIPTKRGHAPFRPKNRHKKGGMCPEKGGDPTSSPQN